MMTAYGSVDTAVEAMKRGAYDFVTKPVNLDQLEIIDPPRAARPRGRKRKQGTAPAGRENAPARGWTSSSARSAAMEDVFDTIRQVAPTRATVLIEGESGTGKELVARALHNAEQPHKAKFIAVHCAALSPQLLESELFGHERGAFTGRERTAHRPLRAGGRRHAFPRRDRRDRRQHAGEDPARARRTHLRAGGRQPPRSRRRAPRRRDQPHLETLVAEGKFRDDLFYRLNVVRIHMPPLRERREDIPLMVQAFLKQSCQENDKPLRELTADAMNRLIEYPWPGNVRELRAAVDTASCSPPGRRSPCATCRWRCANGTARTAAGELRAAAPSGDGRRRRADP